MREKRNRNVMQPLYQDDSGKSVLKRLEHNSEVKAMDNIKMSELDLRKKSVEYREKIVSYTHRAKFGHVGGDLSCVDIVNVLYNYVMDVSPETFGHRSRDRYIHSKGHAALSLYVTLADRGFFPESELDTLGKYRSDYIFHPTRKVKGVEQNTGALGHGLPLGVGMAIAGKRDRSRFRVYVLMGDGELEEGSVWEACMIASHYQLDNLVAIVDRNYLQITGKTEEISELEPLATKLQAFGWHVVEVDGHDIKALIAVFESIRNQHSKPTAVIARTIKGKGIGFTENNALWHHGTFTDIQLEQALDELARVKRGLSVEEE